MKLRPWFRWFLVRLLIASMLYTVGYTALNLILSARVDRALAAIASRGEPVESTDLAQPEVPRERDAGPFFRASCELWRALEPEWEERFEVWLREDGEWQSELGEPLDATRLATARSWYSQHPTLRVLLNELSQRPDCRSDVDFGPEGPYTLLPDLMEAKGLASAQLLGSWLEAKDGQFEQAIERQSSIYDLARCVGSDRNSLISVLVEVAIERLGHEGLRVLLAHDLNDQQLAQLERGLARAAPLEDAARSALLGERAGLGVFCFQALLQGRRSEMNPEGVQAGGPLRLLLLADFAVYLDYFERALAEEAFPEDNFLRIPSYAVMTSLLLPALHRFELKVEGAAADRRLAQLALTLRREHLRLGAYPEQLSEALGQVKGVRYQNTLDGVVISLQDPSWSEGYDPDKRWLSFRLPD